MQTEYEVLMGKKPDQDWTENQLADKEKEARKAVMAQLEALTGEKPHHKTGSDKLVEMLKEEESKREIAPPLKLGKNGVLVDGNRVNELPEGHYFKDYQFEDVRGASGYFHVGVIPCLHTPGIGKTPLYQAEKNSQMPFPNVLSPVEWQVHKPRYEKSTNIMFDILHDPFK